MQQERVSPCFWTSQGCRPDALVWFSPSGAPSSVYHRMLMMSVERKGWCGLSKDKKSCMADVKHRCFWVASQEPKCQNADTYELETFISKTFLPDAEHIPHAITCPGSLAREFFACYAHPAVGLCAQLPGCALGTMPGVNERRCFPKWYTSAPASQQAGYRAAIQNLDPSFFGNCLGACWLKQSSKCVAQKRGSDCTSRPFCRYIPETKSCFRKIWETDKSAADASVDQLYKNCYMMTSKKTCEERRQITLQQFGKFLDWSVDSAPVTCGNQAILG